MKIYLLSRFFSTQDRKLYSSIRNLLGFRPGNIHLYKLAFLHKSASLERINGMKIDNERLEFLGDAVISLAVADYLFKCFPLKDEGFLTETRSKLVSRNQLNKLAAKIGIDAFIQSGSSITNHSKYIRGNTLEALIGAIYLDKGFPFAKQVFTRKIIGRLIDIEKLINEEFNFKSQLLEWAQKERKNLEYRLISERANGRNKLYTVDVVVDEAVISTGTGLSIKSAEQDAAEKAIPSLILSAPLNGNGGQ